MPEEVDEFGIPIRKNNQPQVDEFGIPIKKKVASPLNDGGEAGSGKALSSVSVKNLSSSIIAPKKKLYKPEAISEYNKKFEDLTGHKELSLGSNLPQIAKAREESKYIKNRAIEEYEINPVINAVRTGTVQPQQLSKLYNTPYGKKIVGQIVSEQVPAELQYSALDDETYGADRKWEQIANVIQEKNRGEGIALQENYEQGIDADLNNKISNFKLGKEMSAAERRHGGGDNPTWSFEQIDVNDPAQLRKALEQLEGAEYIVGEGVKNGAKAKQDMANTIREKLIFLKSKEAIPEQFNQYIPAVEAAVNNVTSVGWRKTASPEQQKEYAELDKQYVIEALNYLRDENPAKFTNIANGILQAGKIADTDYTDVLIPIGKKIYDQRNFKSGSVVKEDNRDFSTHQGRRAEMSLQLSEKLKQMGYKNKGKTPDSAIVKAAAELGIDPSSEEALAIRRDEANGGYGIVKGGGLTATARGAASPIKAINQTINAIFDSPVKNYLNSRRYDYGDQSIPDAAGNYSNVLPSERNAFDSFGNFFNKGLEGFGQFMTQVGGARALGALIEAPYNLAAGKFAPRAALTAKQSSNIAAYGGGSISTLAQTYGQSYLDFLNKTGDPNKSSFMALTDALGQTFLEVGISPDVKIAESMEAGLKSSRQNLAKNIIGVIEKGGSKEAIKPFVTDFVKETSKILGKEVGIEETSQNMWNYMVENLFSPKTGKDRNLPEETAQTLKEAGTQMLLPAILGGFGEAKNKASQQFSKDALHTGAINFDKYKEYLTNSLTNGTVSQQDYDKALNILSLHNQSISNAPKRDSEGELISTERQLEYAYQNTIAEINQDLANKQTDKIQQEPFLKKVEEADKIKRKIFYGEEVKGLPKTEPESKPDTTEDDNLLTKITSSEGDVNKGEQGAGKAGDEVRKLAEKIRGGKISKLGGFKSGTGFDAIWDASLEVVAKALEGGAAIADAIQEGINHFKNTDWYKNLSDKKEFEDKYTEHMNNKLGGGPPKQKDTNSTTTKGDERDKGILNHLYKAKNISDAAKKGFEEEGLKYETKSQEEAEQVAKGVIAEMGIDDAVAAAEAMKFDGDVNSLIFAESLNQLKLQEDAAATPEEKLAAAKKFAEIGITYDKMARYGGRFNAAINYFYKKSPLGIVMMENAKRKDDFKQWAKGKNQSWEEFYDEMMREPEFEAVAKQKMQEELKAERAKGRKARIEKVRSVFKAAKDKFKKEGGGTYGTIIPPHIIETVLEAMELAYEAGEAVTKIIGDAIDSISKKIGTTSWDKDKFRAEWEDALKEDGGKKLLSDEELKRKILDKIKTKLKGLSDKQREELISKAAKKIIENNGLDYEDFRKLIAEAVGRADLTDAEAAQIKDLVAKTNAVEDAAEAVRTERTDEAFVKLRTAEIEAGRALKELNELFHNKPDIVKRLTSIMQLSTLGIPALVNNPVYNLWNQATLRFPIGVINDLIDRGIGGIAKLFGKNYDREYNVLGTQAEFWSKLGLGAKESIGQLGTGLSRMDYTQKEVAGQQIRPFRSLRDLYKHATGQKPLTKAQWWDKALQGTVGIPAEIVARVLNLGDKPQRFAAVGAQASAFAKTLGLKGMDYKIFIEFPREEAYRAYKAQGLSDEVAGQKADAIKKAIIKEGERSTFQQDNLLNDAITRAAGVLGGKDSGTATLAKTLVISPYIKIPTNAFWSTYNLINPEIAILQSLTHAGISYNAKKKGELTKAKLQSREARYWMAHAIVGMGMRAAVIALVKAGTFVPSDDDKDSKKERDADALFERPGYVNVGSLKISNRWFGQWGMMGNAIAKKYEDATPEQREAQDDFWNTVLGGMEWEALKEMENGVFANSSSILQSFSTGDFSRYGTNTLNMFANILQPASIAQINRAALDEVPSSKGDSFLDKLNKNFAQRSTLYRRLFNVQLDSKLDVWGDPIPKGGNILSRMFGVSKGNPQVFGRPIYNDFLRTNDSGFLPPAVLPLLNGQKLNTKQDQLLQKYIGSERKKLAEPYVNNMAEIEGFKQMYKDLTSDEEKKFVLQYLYGEGRAKGLELFYKDYPEFKPKEEPIDYNLEVKKDLFKILSKYKK